MLRKVVLSLGLALCTAGSALAQVQPPKATPHAKPDPRVEEANSRLKTFMQKCTGSNVAALDDRLSSAEIVARGLTSYCWATGGQNIFMEIVDLEKLQPKYAVDRKALYQSDAQWGALVVVLQHRVSLQESKH